MKHELNDDLRLWNNGSKRLVSVLRGRKSRGERFPPDLLVNLGASCICRAKRINQYAINRHKSNAAIEMFFSLLCSLGVTELLANGARWVTWQQDAVLFKVTVCVTDAGYTQTQAGSVQCSHWSESKHPRGALRTSEGSQPNKILPTLSDGAQGLTSGTLSFLLFQYTTGPLKAYLLHACPDSTVLCCLHFPIWSSLLDVPRRYLLPFESTEARNWSQRGQM